MTAVACVGRHLPNATPTHEPGLLLCRHCLQRLRRNLQTITDLWPLLADLAQPGSSQNSSHGKPGSRPPCNIDVTDITDPRGVTHAQVTGWARIVIEERRLASNPADVEQAARLLAVHADWVAAQPWVDECMLEVADAAWRIRRACHDLPDPPIGTCPDVDPDGQQDRCGGPLRWVDGTTAVRCTRCGSSWAEADLPNILRVVEPTRRFPVPRAWVVIRYAIQPDLLRQWIRRGHVKTYSDEQVELFDVLARVTDTPNVATK